MMQAAKHRRRHNTVTRGAACVCGRRPERYPGWVPEFQDPVHGEFIFMRRWASGTTLDNASASGRNLKLVVVQIRRHPVLVDVHPSLHACDEH